MKKKKKFNIIYNNDENVGMGKGYYIIYENHKGEPTFDSKYYVLETENNYFISSRLIHEIYEMYDLDYVLDTYYRPNLKEVF